MKKQTKTIIAVLLIVGVLLLYANQMGFLSTIQQSQSSSESLSTTQGRLIKRGLFNLFATGLELCKEFDDCPPGTEQNCQQDSSGDWYYTCDSINIDCSDDPSYGLDCSRWCPQSGYIYSYNLDVCCPPTHPYTNDGSLCYPNYQVGSDNYYVRHSDLTCLENPRSECDGFNLKECGQTEPFIIVWIYKGKVIGRCGVECLDDFNCPSIQFLEKTCIGNNLMQKVKEFSCSNNKCISTVKSQLVETCDYECGEANGNIQCIVQVCTDGELKCSGDDLLICENNQFKLFKTCEKGCENQACKTIPIKNITIIVSFILIIIGLIVFYFWLRKK